MFDNFMACRPPTVTPPLSRRELELLARGPGCASRRRSDPVVPIVIFSGTNSGAAILECTESVQIAA